MTPYNLTQTQKKQVEIFKESLINGNEKINLFSRKEPEKQLDLLLQENIYAALLLAPILKNFTEKVLDIGSGNGFPGIICGILYPETSFVLCERNRKKTEFLKSTIFKLEAKNIEILCKNIEDAGLVFKKVLSQATAPIKEVLKILDKTLDKEEGEAFLWKNDLWERDWPEKSAFTAEIFKRYETKASKRILLRIKPFKPNVPHGTLTK